MSHLLVLPIVLPAVAAALLVLLSGRVGWQRALGLASSLAQLAIAILLVMRASGGAIESYALGDWPPPFGIALVLDRLAAAMVLLTTIVALAGLVFACGGADARGRHFHPLWQFQLMGLNGAFLTGDLFNLFVFFEVLLIASYGLLLHGGGLARLRSGFHYVTLNLAGSALFLVGVSLLYAMTGTLNMADMAVRVGESAASDVAIVQAAGLLLGVVFALKAALVPLHFWLPATYAAASPPVAALFAIMTKLGVYAIVRLALIVFGLRDAAETLDAILLVSGLAAIILATVGVLGAATLKRLIGYATIASVGLAVAGVGLGSAAATGAALYYLVQSTLVIALLFLVAHLIARGRGKAGDTWRHASPVPQAALLGSLFAVAAVTLAGIPPLSGFLGKLMLLGAAAGQATHAWFWSIVLVNALVTVVAFARAGSALFWFTTGATPDGDPAARVTWIEAVPLALLVAAILGMTAWAEVCAREALAAGAQLADPSAYVEALFGGQNARPRTGIVR